MKRLLLFLTMALTLFGVSRAADEVVATCLFGSTYNSKAQSSYTNTWTAKNGDITWDITNANNNNNDWSYIKMGSKNDASVGTIINQAPFDKAITKVELTIDAITATSINSIKLYSGVNINSFSEVGSFTKASGTQTVTISNPQPNLYYKIEVSCAKASSNGPIQISKIQYYANSDAGSTPTAPSTLTFSPNGGNISTADEITISSDENTNISYTIDGGSDITYSAPFTLSAGTHIVNAKAWFGNDTDYTKTASATFTVTDNSQGGGENPGGDSTDITDVLTLASTTASGSTYSDWTVMDTKSGAIYAGNSAGSNNSIQLRSDTKNDTAFSGIVSTTSGGNVTKVSVTWNSNTSNGRTLDVYAKKTAYNSTSELYDTNYSGTKIGTIVCGTSTELSIPSGYEYIGMRSNSNAMYLSEIDITWSKSSTTEPEPELKVYDAPFANKEYSISVGESLKLEVGNPHPEEIIFTITDPSLLIEREGYTFDGKAAGTTEVVATWAEDEIWKAGSAKFTVTVNEKPQGSEDTEEVTFDFSKPSEFAEGEFKASTGTVVNDFSKGNIAVHIDQAEKAGNDQMLRFYNVTDFRCSAAGGKMGHTFTIYTVNGAKIKRIEFKASKLNLNDDPAGLSNDIWVGDSPSITFTTTEQNVITKINVIYEGTDPEPEVKELGEIVATVSDGQTLDEDVEEITITKGTSITFTSENATKIELSCDEAEIELVEDGNTLTWKPDILLKEGYVLVKASAEIDGKTAEKEFLFIINVVNPQIGDIKATYLGKIVENDSKFTVHKGTIFTFSAENATSILVEGAIMNEDNSDIDALHTLAEADSDQVTWTATEAYENMHIVVTAWVDKENESQNNATMSFNITVDEPKTDEDHTNPHAGDKYEMITDVADLIENCHYVIAYTGGNVAMSTATVSSGQMGGDIVEIQDGILTATDNTLVFNLTTDVNGNYLWNFVNYEGKANASQGLGNTSSTNFTVTNPTPSTIGFNDNGDAKITFTNNTANQILYRKGYNFKYYSSQNVNNQDYYTVQIYKLSSWEELYYDFTHKFTDQTVGKDKEIVLFDDDEEYPSNLNFMVETPGIIEITKDGVIKGLEIGSTNVTVSWEKDEVNHFNASEGTITFNVEVIEEMSGMFDFTTKDPYGMTTTSNGSTYEKNTPITGQEAVVTMTLDGKFRSWEGTNGSFDLRLYKTDNSNAAGSITFSVPFGYKMESIEFTKAQGFNNVTASTGEIKGTDWNAEDDVTTKSVTFTADNGTATILTATVNYAKCDESVYLFGTTIEGEWDDEWKAEGNKVKVLFMCENVDYSNFVTGDEVTFSVNPVFEVSEGKADETADGDYTPVEKIAWSDGTLAITFPCSGLYEIVATPKSGFVINGSVDPTVIGTANIYPSMEGFYLSYETNEDNDDIIGSWNGETTKKFPFKDGKITYQFEEDPTNHEIYDTTKTPFVNVSGENVEVWYKLHGLGNTTPSNAKARRVASDPQKQGFTKVGEDGMIDLSDLADYDSASGQPRMSVILTKNGASTPVEESLDPDDDEVYSTVLIDINKGGNYTVAVESIFGDTEGEAEFYTLDGLKVNAENLQNGLYIVKKGQKAVKVLIKN